MLARTNLALIAGLFTATAFAVPAVAQQGPRGGGPAQMFQQADTDGSGTVSKSEVEAQAGKRFSAMDTNGDGYVTAEEVQAHAMQGAQDRSVQKANRMIGMADTDGDGKVSAAENKAVADEHFSKMDVNGDGEIAPGEPRQAFKGMKAGGSGGQMPGAASQ